jgi:hypothetical protein
MMMLLTVHRKNGVSVPVNPQEFPPAALDSVPLSRLLDEGIVSLHSADNGTIMRLTPHGLAHLRGMLIDYHLELMDLRRGSNEFFSELVDTLKSASCSQIVLYGASDTARVLLDFLKDSGIRVTGILDDDRMKQGTRFGGVPVFAPSQLASLEFDSVVVTTVLFQDRILKDKARIIPASKRLIGLFDDLLIGSGRR